MKIERMPQGFGAVITGFDIQSGSDPDDIARLRRCYDEQHLLVFRDCGRIAAERQVEISGWFGKIGANSGSDGRNWTVLDNDEAAGSAILPFHSDISFMEFPIEGISLHPLRLPDGETSTSFISNVMAWAALPAALQDELRDRTARHFYADSATMNFDWPVLEHWHPVRLRHRRTRMPMLFVTEHHVDRIACMSEERSAELLGQLFEILYAPERRYEHVWREGDLLIWDNLAIQHARTREAAPSGGTRALQRVAIGEHGFVEQLERARRRQPVEV